MGLEGWPRLLTERIPAGIPLTLRDLIGRPVRIIEYGNAHTMEFIPGRVTLQLGPSGLVTEVQVEEGDSRS